MSALSDDIGGYSKFSFAAEFYDYVVPYRERNDVAFFVEEARSANGPVLELGCGKGRVLIPAASDDGPDSPGFGRRMFLQRLRQHLCAVRGFVRLPPHLRRIPSESEF